jgi:probable rRNA maturation factor
MKILIKNQQRHRSLNKTKIVNTACNILTLLEQPPAELSILFVGDRKMQQLNSTYRGRNKSTDVLSFESQIPVAREDGIHVLGDIVINVPCAERQAETSCMGFYDEISRLLIHGTLHLLGYEHENSSSGARTMIKKEQEIFDAAKKIDSER